MKKVSFLQTVIALVKKDAQLELRQQYALYGVILYMASTIFVIYLLHGRPEATIWNSLFWISQLFAATNAIAKSFLQESKGKLLYYYTISGAVPLITSKIIFNVGLMLCMNLISILLFALFLGNPVLYLPYFLLLSSAGAMGLAILFTFLAAIAAKAQQQAAIMAIMGFPLLIPQLLLLQKLSLVAFSSVVQQGFWQLWGTLLGFQFLVIALAVILFPFLWKD